MDATPDWTAARARMMLDPTVVNLNTGSFGPTPRPVFDRVTELRTHLAAEPTDFFVRRVPELLWTARMRMAEFLGADPKRLLFTTNVSHSINIVAAGLRLSGPGEILMTDHEYGAMHWTWERAAIRQGLALRTFPLPVMATNPAEIVDAFVRELRPSTRLLFFSHVLSPTGLVLPAREICAETKRRGILTVVDGAHAPLLLPLDMREIAADFYGGNGHKWLLAPMGTGFLCLGPNAEDRLQPLQVSWGYHCNRSNPDERDEYGSTPRLRALEFEGSRDVCPWLASPAAIDFQSELGLNRIRSRMHELSRYARERLVGLNGIRLATAADPRMHASMTAYEIPDCGLSWSEIRQRFWDRGIEIPVIERPGRLLFRVSSHFYTTPHEIDVLAAAVPEVITPG